MAYVNEEGVYRCRLQLDNGHPCIDIDTHYEWDFANRCPNKSKPLGGAMVIFRADAYRLLDNGDISPVREDLDLSNIGITIITTSDNGEQLKHDVIANFIRIFGLRDTDELLAIASVNPQQLINAEFDVRARATKKINPKTGKPYLSFWVAAVGEAVYKPRPFASGALSKALLNKYRSKMRVECRDIVPTTPPMQDAETLLPTREKTSMPASVGLPPRASEEPVIDLNKVWSMWISAYPEDTQGNAFYTAVAKMFGENREATSLNPYELSAFCKANIPADTGDDDENPPF